MDAFLNILKHTLIITSFVMTMMLIIEFVNIRSRGNWSKKLAKSRWSQLILGSVLGIIPGCMGTYTIVSLYTHNVVGLGALVAAMIATSGDEAFVMISMIPDTTVILTGLLFGIAILVGFLVNLFTKNKKMVEVKEDQFPIHENEEEFHSNSLGFIARLRKMTFQRAILIFGIILVILGLFIGDFSHSHGPEGAADLNLPNELHVELHDHDHEHDHHHDHDHGHDHAHDEVTAEGAHAHEHGKWDWMTITLLVTLIVSLIIVTIVSDHFLEHHLWDHIIKVHFLKILLWTFGAMVFIHFIIDYMDVGDWMKQNQYIVLIVALLIGIIPESGPHLVFVTLFFSGNIPFSILMANSIVQDGHGALPLLAESKRGFVVVKAINLLVGLVVGLLGILFHF
jgi:hypothetical protein